MTNKHPPEVQACGNHPEVGEEVACKVEVCQGRRLKAAPRGEVHRSVAIYVFSARIPERDFVDTLAFRHGIVWYTQWCNRKRSICESFDTLVDGNGEWYTQRCACKCENNKLAAASFMQTLRSKQSTTWTCFRHVLSFWVITKSLESRSAAAL